MSAVNPHARCIELGLDGEARQGTEFRARGRMVGTPDVSLDRPPGTFTATIRMRQVGWLDQRGRFWDSVPPAADFTGGSLTPLLIQLDMEDLP